MLNSMRVLGAVRLSRSTEASTSPERQRDRIQWWADGHDAEVIEVTEDLDVSGAVDPFKREGLGQWLTDERAGEWDVLVAWKLDRISRSALDTLRLLEWCLERKKRIVAVDDGIDTDTEMGRVWVQLASIFAQVERNAIKERTAKGREALRRAGRWSGETVHYGYQTVQRDGGWYLEIDPPARDVILSVIDDVSSGRSVQSIADRLTSERVPTPRDRQRQLRGKQMKGATWNAQTLFKLLGSKTLLGYTTVKGETDTSVQKAPPILTGAEFRRLQEFVSARRTGKAHNRTNKASPLLNIALCYECEKALYQRSQKVNGKSYRYYYCPNKCGGSLRADELEELLEEAFLDELGSSKIQQRVFVPASDSTEELENARMVVDEITDTLSRTSSRSVRASLMEQLEALDAQISELESQPSQPARYDLVETDETYRHSWENRTVDERRELLLSSGITVQAWKEPRSESLRFHLCIPDDIRERVSAER